MEEKEIKELIQKITNADNDPKGARVAMTVFINKADDEEAKLFLKYLDHGDPAVKKVARSILGQKAVIEACNPLILEFLEVVKNLTFMPDEEYKENFYYANLSEILETIFNIVKNTSYENDAFYSRLVEIFKKTKNEDLRFSMIKALAIMGDQFDYFMEIYDDLTEKERRALYYVYTFVKDPRGVEIFKKGLGDDRNFEYVVANMLNYEQGRIALAEELLNLGNYNKQTVLKKLQDGKYPEFNDSLIKLLSDKNKFLVELSIENLKNSISSDMSLEPFINMINTGYSPDGIQGALEIISHFVKKQPEDIYMNGLEAQPSHRNKTVILDFFIEQLKDNIEHTEHLTEKVMPKLLVFFDVYNKEKEELFFSIFKIIPNLFYTNSTALRSVKKKIIGFKRDMDKRLSTQFKNNLSEFVVKLNSLIGRFEESENKIKNIVVLFDIDPHKIDAERMTKLKEQLNEVEALDEETHARMVDFLVTMYEESKIDWKIRAVATELLGDYGTIKVLPKLKDWAESDSSLAVKVNAEKAAAKVEEKFQDSIESVLIVEPLFYIQKKLNEFFKSRAFRVFNLDDITKLPEVAGRFFKFLVVTETLLNPESAPNVMEYLDENLDTILIIVSGKPDDMDMFQGLENVRFLLKPFNDDTLTQAITG